MEQQKCYVFKAQEERPAKRRRVQASAASRDAFQEQRKLVCEDLWTEQQKRIDTVLESVNRSTLDSIVGFIADSGSSEILNAARIPTGLVVAGPSIASHGKFFGSLAREVVEETSSCFVSLSSNECPNLKTLLKNLISKATSQVAEDEDGEEQLSTRRKGPKLLNYDLQILYEWFQEQDLRHVVVAIQDSEASEGHLLADAISLLSAWRDRIPFILLFGIATSAESFQEKLPTAAIRCLDGQKFDVVQADVVLEQVFSSMFDGENVPLRLGPALVRRLLERHRDHIQSIESFVDALKYAYMSHFFANPLSIFLQPDLEYRDVSGDVMEALRNLDSFRKTAEDLLEQGETTLVRQLLESDEDLFAFAKEQLAKTQEALFLIVSTALELQTLRRCIPRLPSIPLSSLYIRAMSGDLLESPLTRDFLLSVKKAPSDLLSDILQTMASQHPPEEIPPAISRLESELEDLLASTTNATAPLRSAHDLRNESLRTTIVAQKVQLSKQRSALSQTDSAYSQIVEQLHTRLANYFKEFLVRPQDLFMHEIALYDLKSPHMDVFMPRPRFAIERALAAPHDYLNCVCCGDGGRGERGGEATLASTQPATAIVYQLYLESGSLINVSDLWSAFHAIVCDDEADETKAMALFQRSLAELRYLGLVKASRKKTDHIAKLVWKGL
ncbi:hypothetical protein K490DRAFT_40083 [Saccharata proteae CBS 121410]|uniref:Origin recognition complex subunit n=1 Tax=Saccharata proteae CBS 121410 TaxID=1314787 RepID=A0A9P4HZA1_9PEZI|nr:hypothetical protein K490DRAFT_40083 [Saccharata proteae CBS 121410]